MTVRDARPEDLSALAERAGTSTGAVETMLTHRTIRVDVSAEGDVRGFVSFDATESSVEITRIAGEAAAIERLLEEPLAFGEREGLPVETVVPRDDDRTREALGKAGFRERGSGPRFQGTETIRYRQDA